MLILADLQKKTVSRGPEKGLQSNALKSDLS